MAATTSSCIRQPVIYVSVPAALIKVRIPSSLNKFLLVILSCFGLVAALAEEKDKTFAKKGPAKGVAAIYFKISLRRIKIYY